MAKENRNGTSGTETDVQLEPTGAGKGSEDTSSESTRKGRGRTRTDSGTITKTTEEKVSGLVDVKPEPKTETGTDVPIPTLKKAKQKRTRKTNKKKNDTTFNAEQITAILLTVSAILSNSESTQFFALSKREAEQIAEPLANIIATNDSLNALSKHSDSIALVTACFMIFVPKLVMFLTYKKQQKALKEKGVKIMKGVKENDKTGKTSSDSGRVNRTVTDSGETNDNGTLSAIPSIM